VKPISRREDARQGETSCVFRELNEEIAGIARSLPPDGLPAFLCECGGGCTKHVELSLDEYEDVRAHPALFVVLPGHDRPELEIVVSRTDRFCVVEKQAPVSLKLARARDPRQRAGRTEPPGQGMRELTLAPLA
jgi:hypothetical protein